MSKVIVTFEGIQGSDLDKVKRMVESGIFDLGDGGFWEEECEKNEIDSFDSSAFSITTEV